MNGWCVEVLHSSYTICTHNLPDIYTLNPRASGVAIYQATTCAHGIKSTVADINCDIIKNIFMKLLATLQLLLLLYFIPIMTIFVQNIHIMNCKQNVYLESIKTSIIGRKLGKYSSYIPKSITTNYADFGA